MLSSGERYMCKLLHGMIAMVEDWQYWELRRDLDALRRQIEHLHEDIRDLREAIDMIDDELKELRELVESNVERKTGG